jgi:hypothetical protein
LTLEVVYGQRYAPAALHPGKETRAPLRGRLGGPRVSVWMDPGNLVKLGMKTPTIQRVESCYTA